VSKTFIKQIQATPTDFIGQTVTVKGWIRTQRSSKTFGFIEINDGSAFKNLQIVYTDTLANYADIDKLTIGSAIAVTGVLVASQGAGQAAELQATAVDILGLAAPDNPITKKRHTLEHLRTMPHLRVRTNTFMATFRVRSLIAHATHLFFQDRGFVYVHTPIITSTDAEGAGEMFRLSTFDADKMPTTDGKYDPSKELLGKETFLTVSGQLNVEPFCFGFGNVYTFGPTFRAEHSNTSRHANEFWMIEPEIAFADLNDNMDLAEAMLKYIINYVLTHAPAEMQFFNDNIDKTLLERLQSIVANDFARITYTEAIGILQKSGEKFEYPTDWGEALQTEHERYLAETVFKKPVFVTDYPVEFKAFYMRLSDDKKTVRAMDLLVPDIGEIIGGSQREERLDVLLERMEHHGLRAEDYSGYLDVRRFGTFPHAGFGLGFERAVMYITGMKNIRDVIPYPRTPNNAAF
jgi:asparaginyl-tRNA synthetase